KSEGDVVAEVSDTVADEDAPPRGRSAQVVEANPGFLRLFECQGQTARNVDDGQLALAGGPDLVERTEGFLHRPVRGHRLRRPNDRRLELPEKKGIAAAVVELAIATRQSSPAHLC